MATVPTPYDWTAGVAPTAAQLDAGVRDVGSFLLAPPRCSLYTSSGSVANNAWTAVLWDSEHYDNDDMHSTASNTGRLVFRTAGLYLLNLLVFWLPHATGQRGVNLTKNGAGTRAAANVVLSDSMTATAGAGGATVHAVSVMRAFAANDYIEMFVYQNSGGALSMQGGYNNSTLQAHWMGV